jgi:hypothetical protein
MSKVTMPDSQRQFQKSAIQFVLLLFISALWIATIVLAFIPNNRLWQMGLGNAIAIDMTLGVLFAIFVAIFSIRHRTQGPLPIFILVQVLAWAHGVGIWLLLIVVGIVAPPT